MITKPSAVLLDVGGVFLLPDHEPIRSGLREVGIEISDDTDIDRAHYLAVRAFPMSMGESGHMESLWLSYLEAYASALGIAADSVPVAAAALRSSYLRGGLWSREIPDSRRGLAELARTGVDVGIVSNADGTIESRLSEMALLHVGDGPGTTVSCVVDSGVVGHEKPDPRIFEPALAAIGPQSGAIWYVGDTPAFDIVGARRAGLEPILMDPFEINADYDVPTVGSLTEVAELVRSV